MPIEEWLERVYTWERSTPDLLDEIYDHLTVNAEAEGMRGWVMHADTNEILSQIDVTRLSPTILTGFLTVTFKAMWMGSGQIGNVRHELPARPEFYEKVAAELRGRNTAQVEEILRGLR